MHHIDSFNVEFIERRVEVRREGKKQRTTEENGSRQGLSLKGTGLHPETLSKRIAMIQEYS